jgi:hypothetical protein
MGNLFLEFIYNVFQILPLYILYWLIGYLHRRRINTQIMIREEQLFKFQKSIIEQKLIAANLKKDIDENYIRMTKFKDDILTSIDKLDYNKIDKLDKIIKTLNIKL